MLGFELSDKEPFQITAGEDDAIFLHVDLRKGIQGYDFYM